MNIEIERVEDVECRVEGSSRECKHFIRVNERDGLKNIINCRGFCVLGQLEGDYSLMCSCSICHECHAFIYDGYNAETTKLEQELKLGFEAIAAQLFDRRTAIYKTLSDFSTRFRELMNAPKDMFNHLEERSIAYDFFVERNCEKYRELANRTEYRYIDYSTTLNWITKKIADSLEQYDHHGFGKAQCPAAVWDNGANDYYCRWANVCKKNGFPDYCPLPIKKKED